MTQASASWANAEGQLADGVIVVGFGGNLGGPAAVRERCVSALATLSHQWGPARISSYLITAPIGEVQEQPDFVNAVAAWRPAQAITPEAALAVLQEIERSHGRTRLIRGGARTLDLDLLLLGQERRSGEALVLPHPRMAQRAFVLQPLFELFGGRLQIDASGESVAQCLGRAEITAQKTQLDL